MAKLISIILKIQCSPTDKRSGLPSASFPNNLPFLSLCSSFLSLSVCDGLALMLSLFEQSHRFV
jgi:hypothetical protein